MAAHALIGAPSQVASMQRDGGPALDGKRRPGLPMALVGIPQVKPPTLASPDIAAPDAKDKGLCIRGGKIG